MPVELFIARRHLLSHKKVGFISFISVLSIAGVAIGVASLILTLSIVEGFEREIKDKIIGFDSHIRVRQYHFNPMSEYEDIGRQIESVKGVRDVYPYILKEAVIRSREDIDGILVEGVTENDETFRKQSGLKSFGDSFSLDKEGSDLSPIILGSKLASGLKVAVGDTVTVMVFNGVPGPFNTPFARQFEILGTFQTGMAEFDGVFVYIPLYAAQELFRMSSSVTGIKVFVDDSRDAGVISAAIEEKLGGYPFFPLTWEERHKNLFKWLDTQRLPMLFVFGLIALVALFNITSTLAMIVIDKTHDIGVLKAIGFKTNRVLRIFLAEGGLIGGVGALIGMILAYGLGVLQQNENIIALPPDVYFMNALPVLMQPEFFFVTGAGALALSLAATAYPALKAARLMPADTLRDE